MIPIQTLMAGVLLAACAVAAAQDCSDIAGDWQGTWSETDCFLDVYSGDWTAVITSSCNFTGGDTFGEISGLIDPFTGFLTASQQGTECGVLSLTGTFQNDSASGGWTYSFGGGGSFNGSRVIVDTDGDGDPDVTDPDDDNDGITDALDTEPLNPNNFCSGLDPFNVTFQQVVTGNLTCAAQVSITVVPLTTVLVSGDLRLIAPTVAFQSGFAVAGGLTVISAHPCPACSP